ncbi:MAG: zinc-binding dehydrogenase [Streptosporangiaceae bacterium]|nr:zinc-binding dehydrogenase [Streptosporangiaceae bacterium]
MQAIMVSEFGGPEVLRARETGVPRPGPDEVLVRVVAAGVGPWDVSLRRGGWTGSLPYIPGADRVRWQPYDGQPRGSRLIRMAPWFDDGSLSVTVQARYFLRDAAEAHRVAELGHTRGKLVLIADEDLAAALGV